eukprot:TRINITY_DN113776_c0_g1_i1.p1 TRINITY_DN113776_c0_g1~~TRINITY_DN113776_c0_g1_i1.p1  ORF type:complete len:199 (-),score=24.06 TRINITY_DN113776_c0_g1_i1:115-711(-)
MERISFVTVLLVVCLLVQNLTEALIKSGTEVGDNVQSSTSPEQGTAQQASQKQSSAQPDAAYTAHPAHSEMYQWESIDTENTLFKLSLKFIQHQLPLLDEAYTEITLASVDTASFAFAPQGPVVELNTTLLPPPGKQFVDLTVPFVFDENAQPTATSSAHSFLIFFQKTDIIGYAVDEFPTIIEKETISWICTKTGCI